MAVIPGISGEWFNYKRLEKYAPDCPLRMINGARGVGKTVRGALDFVEDWRRGHQTVWVRLFKAHMDSSFVNNFLDAGRRHAGVPDDWVVTQDGVFTSELKEPDEQPVIFMSMNRAFAHQGNEYSNVMHLICDEYTVRPGELYPNQYPAKLHSLMGTLGRGKDEFRATLYSNWTSISNPIWAAKRIYPGKKDVTAFPDKGCAIEICRNGYYNQDMPSADSPLGKAMAGLGMIMESEEEDYSFNMIIPQRPAVTPTKMVLATESGNFRHWAGKWNFFEPTVINPSDWVFTNDVRRVGGQVQLIPSQTHSRLRKELESNTVRFINQPTLYAVMSFLYARYG